MSHKQIILRPHHLLCLQNYRGEGYSDTFQEGMSAVAARLQAHPETPIRIAEGADMLCRHCPNRRGEECTSCRPALFDENVRTFLHIHTGNTLRWCEAKEKTAPLTAQKVVQLCPDCQWQRICVEMAQRRSLLKTT